LTSSTGVDLGHRFTAARRFALACAVGAAAVAGCQTATPTGAQPPAGASGQPSTVSSTPLAAEGFRAVREYQAVAAPVRVRIPAARVNSSLQRLGKAPDGTIEVPSDYEQAGWYAEGPRPGQPGPAVLLGHVDSKAGGPAVFYHLPELTPGTPVHVDREDGSTVSFHVTAVARVPKNRFPTDQVYGPTLRPSLRLVTCGGIFDPATRNYLDNVIVYAKPG
jgi:Sortase domain